MKITKKSKIASAKTEPVTFPNRARIHPKVSPSDEDLLKQILGKNTKTRRDNEPIIIRYNSCWELCNLCSWTSLLLLTWAKFFLNRMYLIRENVSYTNVSYFSNQRPAKSNFRDPVGIFLLTAAGTGSRGINHEKIPDSEWSRNSKKSGISWSGFRKIPLGSRPAQVSTSNQYSIEF